MKKLLIVGMCVLLLSTTFSSNGFGERQQALDGGTFPFLLRLTTFLSSIREILSSASLHNLTDASKYGLPSTYFLFDGNFSYFSSSGNTLFVGGLGPGNYSHIQDAIDNASEGDTIFIYNGTYEENLHISLPLQLIGEQQEKVIIDGVTNTDTVFIQSDGVLLANMTIQHSGNFDAGIKINTNYNRIENCTIVDCWDGIELNNGHYNQIIGCLILHSEKEGIYLLHSHYNIVMQSSLPYNQESIFLDSSNYNVLTAITVQHNKEEGIQIRDSSHNMFSSCLVSSNTFGYGFYIQYDSDDNMISKCDITDNGVGMFFSSSDADGPCGTVISFCNVTDNAGTGIFFMGNGSLMNDTHIHYNNICNNKKGIMAVNANDCFIYAQNNWWGRRLGPRLIGLQRSNRIAWNFKNSCIFFHPWLAHSI